MNILLLGGKHFLGRSLVELILKEGHTLTVLSLDRPHLSDEVKWISCNRNDSEALTTNFKNLYFDVVIDNIAFNPKSVSILLSVLQDKMKRYILTSSVDVYKNNRLAYVKTSEPINLSLHTDPKSYSTNKINSEIVLQNSEIDVEKVIVRPSVVLGRYDNVLDYKNIPNTVPRSVFYPARIIDRMPILVDMYNHRPVNMTYVEDVARAILLVASVKNVKDKIFNIASNETLTGEKIIYQLMQYAGINNHIIPINLSSLPKYLLPYRTPFCYDYRSNIGNSWGLFDNSDISSLGWIPTKFKHYAHTLFEDIDHEIEQIQGIRKLEIKYATGLFYIGKMIKTLPLKEKFDNENLSDLGVGTFKGIDDEGDDQEYAQSINYLLNNNVNVIDTAINYRNQRSEKLIGSILKNKNRSEIFLITKGGYVAQNFKHLLRSHELASSHSCRSDLINESLMRSLLNLQTKIDCYLLHNVENGFEHLDQEQFYKQLTTTFALLEQRVNDGSIVNYGISTWDGLRVDTNNKRFLDLNRVLECAEIAAGRNEENHFKYIELPYNPVQHEASTLKNQMLDGETISTLDYALKKNLKVFVSSPLNQTKVDKSYKGLSPIITSLNFARSHQGVTTCLPGIRQLSHAQEIIESTKDLPEFTMEECEEIIKLYN